MPEDGRRVPAPTSYRKGWVRAVTSPAPSLQKRDWKVIKIKTLMANSALSSGLIGVALIASAPAYAQQAAAEESADDVIIVTGSRIASPNLTSASPLQITSAQAIQSTGAANLQQVLLQSPIFGTPAISRTNSNFSNSGAGVSTIDLRNLGTARTLVLVNGRRFVSGLANDQAVDLNTIPTQFIERVDVLTGGASSIYGSDAVAGVVNIRYKKDFEGIEMGGQMGISQHGDDKNRQFNLTIGGNFAEGKGNVMAYVGYTHEGAVLSKNRKRTAIDQTSTGAAVTGDPADFFNITAPFYSSFAPQGRYFGAGGATIGTFDANGNFINGFSTNGTATRAADGFNRSQYRTIAVPTDRFLIATRANYEIDPAANVFLEATFAKSRTVSVLEPFAIQTAGTNGIFQGSNGYFPVEQPLAGGGTFVNPFIPAALLAQLTDTDGDGLRDVSFSRRLTDIGNRGAKADRTTFRIVTGIEGQISDKWRYDTYINYGRTDDNQTSSGQVNLAAFRSALVVTQDALGNLVCADIQARAQGCVPVNVFGANTISPEAAQYIRADGNRQAFASQLDAGANITGSLGDYWGAGDIGIAIGAEYRRERSSAVNDALTQAGLNGGNAIPNTAGSFNVKEGYAEIAIPLLTDKPFFKSLELRGAARVSKYSTIGTVYSWNYGGTWAPAPDISFRVVKARATRAPNVTELYQGLSQTFPTGLQDPCEGLTAGATGTLADTCRSFPGVNANIAANGGVFTVNQADRQGVSGFDGGNPLLSEEKADTFTAGVVLTPKSIDFLRNFSMTVDYSHTKIKGAIVQTPRQFILQQCYVNGDPNYCQFITRRAGPEGANNPGSIRDVNSGVTNSGGLVNSNIDVGVFYRQNLDNLGALDLSFQYTRVLKFYQIPLPGAAKDYIGGEVGASKNRFLATANYSIGAFSIEYRGTYIGSAYLDDQFVEQFGIDRHDPLAKVKAKYYSDIQAKFEAGDHYEFYVGVNNAFNTSPAPIYSNLPGNSTGTETDAGTYDAIGRRFYAGARIKF